MYQALRCVPTITATWRGWGATLKSPKVVAGNRVKPPQRDMYTAVYEEYNVVLLLLLLPLPDVERSYNQRDFRVLHYSATISSYYRT